jgi:sec-independent protein translocase protein TatA
VISGFGPTELIIVLVIVLLIFGPKRLPGMGKALGSGMKEFKDSITGKDDDKDDDDQPSITAADGDASSTTRTEPERARVDAS